MFLSNKAKHGLKYYVTTAFCEGTKSNMFAHPVGRACPSSVSFTHGWLSWGQSGRRRQPVQPRILTQLRKSPAHSPPASFSFLFCTFSSFPHPPPPKRSLTVRWLPFRTRQVVVVPNLQFSCQGGLPPHLSASSLPHGKSSHPPHCTRRVGCKQLPGGVMKTPRTAIPPGQ